MIKSLIMLTTFCLLLVLDEACLISGKEIGFCSPNVLNKSSFCYNEVNSYICIPAHNVHLSPPENLVLLRRLLQRRSHRINGPNPPTIKTDIRIHTTVHQITNQYSLTKKATIRAATNRTNASPATGTSQPATPPPTPPSSCVSPSATTSKQHVVAPPTPAPSSTPAPYVECKLGPGTGRRLLMLCSSLFLI